MKIELNGRASRSKRLSLSRAQADKENQAPAPKVAKISKKRKLSLGNDFKTHEKKRKLN